MPFILLISKRHQLNDLAYTNELAEAIMDRFWFCDHPQPLTLILKRHKRLPAYITAGSPNIALRYAGAAFLNRLIDISGPITSTSANISGNKTNPDCLEKIPQSIKDRVTLAVESKERLGGNESTIIDVTEPNPSLIRQGAVNFKDILNSFNK